MSSDAAILLVDDNPDVGEAMRIALAVAGHRLDIAATPQDAFSRLALHRYAAVLLDLNFTPGRTAGDEGLACLARILADDPGACVIVITAHSGIRVAVAAMQAGARDFVMKPWRNSELVAKIEAAMARDGRRGPEPARPVAGAPGVAQLLGDSPAMERIRALVRRIGPTMAGVAVTGRSGTGRSLVAAALHAAAGDAERSPITIDLRDPAHWARLDGAAGTLVLRHPDRLDELAQARLLERIAPAARIIAIADAVQGLTPALSSRIATVEIVVPPLAARDGDAVLLARHFARLAAERHRLAAPHLTPAAEQLVLATVWPDEVRGLALAIERAVLLAVDGTIDAAAIAPPAMVAADPLPEASAFDLAHSERAVIAAALREHRHNVTQAAAALGLSRGALYRRMERHGL